jgi:hypothetical protein
METLLAYPLGYLPLVRFSQTYKLFFSQLKSLHLLVALLILVACYINSVNHFSTIQLRLIKECNTDFESYFISVTNFRLVC